MKTHFHTHECYSIDFSTHIVVYQTIQNQQNVDFESLTEFCFTLIVSLHICYVHL